MPVTKSAQKKLRKDRRREEGNSRLRTLLRSAVKKALKAPLGKNIKAAVKIIDKAKRKGIVHKNKASRLKSRISKLTVKKSKSSL